MTWLVEAHRTAIRIENAQMTNATYGRSPRSVRHPFRGVDLLCEQRMEDKAVEVVANALLRVSFGPPWLTLPIGATVTFGPRAVDCSQFTVSTRS